MSTPSDILLRPIKEEDLDRILVWRNSESIRQVMYTDQAILPEEHRVWFNGIKSDPATIVLLAEWNARPFGLINFKELNHSKGCIWGFYVGEPKMPRGTGSRMCFLALEYAFEKLGQVRIRGEAFAFNRRSIDLHTRLGFLEEPALAEKRMKNGCEVHIIHYLLQKMN